MKSFRQELLKPGLSLVYSLPENKVELAEAALAAGVDALKVHLSVNHHASGTAFGSLADEQSALEEILTAADDKIVGIVPGGGRVVSPAEIEPLREMGFTFVSFYAHDCSPEILSIPGIEKMLAPNFTYSPHELTHWARWGVDVIETSVIEPDGYGEPLSFRDIGRYMALTKHQLPTLVPTQRKISPTNVGSLMKAGVNGIMLGAVVTGKDPDTVYQAISEFRRAIDEETRTDA